MYRKRRAGWIDYASALLVSVLLMILLFGQFDGRVVLFFLFMVASTEFFVTMRWRMSVACPHCGFDPVLYVRDQAKASEKVKIHLEKRRNDPAALLARPLHLPVRRIKPADRLRKGQNLSREL